jgi:hypothetical protein
MALVLISDLQSLRTIVANQTRDGADVTAFLEAWHTSVVQRLRGLPSNVVLTTDEKTSICAAVAALPWAADKQAQIVQLVHTPVSVTAAAAASTSRRALQRCEHHFEQYFDDADIEYFASTENSLVGKIGRIVRRCHLSGLQHPSEQTFARMAASLAVFGFSTPIDESSLYNLFVDSNTACGQRPSCGRLSTSCSMDRQPPRSRKMPSRSRTGTTARRCMRWRTR